MSSLLHTSLVRYRCQCDAWRPLCALHFCRYCVSPRCDDCVNWELDSAFCALCLESMPTVNAQEHRNCCRSCVLCPVCSCKLSVRRDQSVAAAVTPVADKDSPRAGQFYVECATCGWSSRRHGRLPLRTSVHGPWLPPADGHREDMFAKSLAHYKTLGNYEKMEKTEKLADRHFGMRSKRTSHLFYSEKYGLAQLYARKGLMGINQPDGANLLAEVDADHEVPELDERVMDAQWPEQSPTLSMRLQQASFNADRMGDLVPVRQRQLLRPCLRCRECGHRVLRLVYSPASIEFKIQAFAVNHVPELRLNRPVVLRADQECDVELVLCNSMRSAAGVTLLVPADDGDNAPALLIGGKRQCHVQMPAPGDEEHAARLADDDDTSTVIYRDGHKVCVRATVTPSGRHKGAPIWVAVDVCYTYADMLADVVEEAAQERDLRHSARINLGLLAA